MMSKQRHVFRICSLFQLVVTSAVIVLVGGGAALLWQLQQKNPVGASAERSGSRFNSFASTTTITSSNDISIGGSPSLPAVTVDTIFKSLGSPMLATG